MVCLSHHHYYNYLFIIPLWESKPSPNSKHLVVQPLSLSFHLFLLSLFGSKNPRLQAIVLTSFLKFLDRVAGSRIRKVKLFVTNFGKAKVRPCESQRSIPVFNFLAFCIKMFYYIFYKDQRK